MDAKPEPERRLILCPYYGFSWLQPFLMVSSGGNQCALIRTAHSPCRMEIDGTSPLLSGCVFAAGQLIPSQALITTHVLVDWKEEITLAEWATRAMLAERGG